MVAQTIRFETISVSEVGSGTITAFLFSEATLAATVGGIAENGTLKGRYTGTVEDIAAGQYRLVVKFNGYTVSESDEVVDLLLAVGTYVSYRAAVLDPAVTDQITAIETFATRVTTGIVQDGAVWQFTANMLELGPSGSGGGSSVNVLPATGIVADRSAGTTLTPVIGETISQSITVYQSDGTTAVDLSGKTLKVIFETMSGVDVAVVDTADITISGADDNVVTFAYPSAVTASERSLKFAIRDASSPLTMYLQGVCSVVSAPKVDA